MTIAYNGRTIPLAASASGFGTSLRLAYDFTQVDSRAAESAYVYQNATNPQLVITGGVRDYFTYAGLPGAQAGTSAVAAQYTSATDFGLAIGTGDYTLCGLFSTPATLPGTSGSITNAIRIDDNASNRRHDVTLLWDASGWYVTVDGNVGATISLPYIGTSTTFAIFIRRASGVASAWRYVFGVDTVVQRRNNDVANTTDWTTSIARRIRSMTGTMTGSEADWPVCNSVRLHNVGLTEAEMASYAADWWAVDDHPPPDTTAPTLTSPTGTKTGTTTASGTVSTDEGDGTLYYWATTNSTETTAAVKASGASQAVSGTGTQSVSFTGLIPSTPYYAHYVHTDAALNDSARVSSSSFITDDVTPGDPSFIVATVTSGTTATISWTAGSPAAGTHTVQVETPSGAANWATATGVLTGVSFAATGLTPATQYRARVQATNGALNSAWVTGSAFTMDNPAEGGGDFGGGSSSGSLIRKIALFLGL